MRPTNKELAAACELSAAAYAAPGDGARWRRCSQCGELTPENSRYCRYCGHEVGRRSRNAVADDIGGAGR